MYSLAPKIKKIEAAYSPIKQKKPDYYAKSSGEKSA